MAISVSEWNQGDYGPRVSTCPEVLAEFIDVLAIAGKVLADTTPSPAASPEG